MSLSPLNRGSGLIPGSCAIPATTLQSVAVFHQHDADQCGLRRLWPSGSHLRHGAPGRDEAAKQLGASMHARDTKNLSRIRQGRCKSTQLPGRQPALRRQALRRALDQGDEDRRPGAFSPRRDDAEGQAPRQTPWPRPCRIMSSRRSARRKSKPRLKVRPQDGSRPARVDAVIVTQSNGQGHEAQLRPGGRRFAPRSSRGGGHHLQRYRGCESRRRFAFKPLVRPRSLYFQGTRLI